MKKIIALALALTMVFSMALSVSAKETFGDGKDSYTSGDVNVVITIDGVHIVHKYAFDIVCGSMEFVYGESLEWNPDDYKYVPSGSAGDWNPADDEANKITVINHSDLPIYCEAEAEVTDTKNGNFTLAVSAGDEIAACDVKTEKGSLSHTMTVTLEGAPSISYAKQIKIGSVVVTVSKKAPATNEGSNTGSNTGSTDGSNGEPTSNAQ